MTIIAPIDGTIADREITIGQSVADSGVKLMTITDDRQLPVMVIPASAVVETDREKLVYVKRSDRARG